jgi:hypothetical protein
MTTLTAPANRKSIAIAYFTAVTLLLGLSSALVSNLPGSDRVWKAPKDFEYSRLARSMVTPMAEASELSAVTMRQPGEREASRLVWCMMPRAWQRDCEAAPIVTAAN